jgi:hypothetical protein
MHRFASAFSIVAVSSLFGCATANTASPALSPLPAIALSYPDDLSADARAVYERERIVVHIPSGRKSDTLYMMRNTHAITEKEFRARYFTMTHSNDLEVDAKRRAIASNPYVIASGVAATVVGIGGLVILGVTGSCSKASGASACSSEGRAVLGLLAIGGAGVYTLGCEAIKGSRCLLDGDVGIAGSSLNRENMEHFAARYNAALYDSLHAPEDHASR